MPKIFRKIKETLKGIKNGSSEDRHQKALLAKKDQPMENKASLVSFNGVLLENGRLPPGEYSDEKLSRDVLPPEFKNKFKSHQKNTGVYLYENGYTPIKCIGVGANGVVWICQASNGENVVVKVTCDSKMFGLVKIEASKEEIANAGVLKKIINGNETNASKYLVISEHDDRQKDADKKRALFTSELADKGDLGHYRSAKQGYARFIEILETGLNVLKGLKILHDAGYSHNDIKPENLLAITEHNSNTAVEQAEKSGDQENIVVKLADFGCITRIKSKLHQKWFANRYFYPPDMQNLREEAVDKRDVYSLGAVLLYLLVGCAESKAKDWAKKLEKSRDLKKFCNLGRGKNLLIMYDLDFNPNKTNKIIAFLKVVQQMVASSYSNRLNVDESFRYMRNVSLMSDG